jgi:hypothetical protein
MPVPWCAIGEHPCVAGIYEMRREIGASGGEGGLRGPPNKQLTLAGAVEGVRHLAAVRLLWKTPLEPALMDDYCSGVAGVRVFVIGGVTRAGPWSWTPRASVSSIQQSGGPLR